MNQTTKKGLNLFWKIICRTITIFIALFVICLLLVFWHLNKRPLDLEFLMPEIQEYILPENQHLKLEADSIKLSAKLTRSGLFHIDIKNMSLLGKNDILILDLPKVEISYGLFQLLTLNYMPTIVRVNNALLQLTLTKNEELLLQSPDTPETIESNLQTPALIEEPSKSEAIVMKDIRHFLTYLLSFKRLALTNASMIIDDTKTGKRIFVPLLDFQLRKHRLKQYQINLKTNIRMQEDTMHLKGNATLNLIAQTASFDFFFDKINLSKAERIVPLLKGLNVPLQGEISGTLDFAQKQDHWRNMFKKLNFTINTIQGGDVQLPEPLNTIYPVSYLVASGSFTERLNALKIKPITASLTTGLTSDVAIDVSGIGTFLDTNDFNHVKTILKAKLINIPIEEIPSVWPSYLGPTAHEWIKKNLKDGSATTALFALYFKGIELTDLKGNIDVKNVTVDYLSPMQPVKNVAGKVLLYPDKVEIYANTGTINNIQLHVGNVYLTNLQDDISQAKIELDIAGPLPEILTLIDSKPLTLLSDFAIIPDKTNGNGKGQITLSFPLTSALKPKDVLVDVNASVTNGSFKTPSGEEILNNASLTVLVNNDELSIQGNGLHKQVPLNIKWSEFFFPTKNNPTRTRLLAHGALSTSFLKQWYNDISDYIIGIIQGKIIYQKQMDGSTTIQFNTNLTNTEFMLHPISYTKIKQVPATLVGEIFLNKNTEPNLINFDLTADNDALNIKGQFKTDTKEKSIILNQLKAPGSNFSGNLKLTKNNDILIKIKGKEWLMTELKNTPFFKKQSIKNTQEKTKNNPVQTSLINIDADISLDSLTLHTGAPLKQVAIKAKRQKGLWKNLFVFARGKEANSINLTSSNQEVNGLIHNIGDLLKRLNISDSFANGNAQLSAKQNPSGTIHGILALKNLYLKNPGFLMQAFTILGIMDAFRGKELTFNVGSIPFELTPHLTLTINDGVIYGTSLGITFTGTISPTAIHLTGSVIPAYAVNSLPGRIPLIGTLFKDSKHGGLMGVNYTITGTPANPQVEFHPLSSIAPGILGRLFK